MAGSTYTQPAFCVRAEREREREGAVGVEFNSLIHSLIHSSYDDN